MSSIKKFTTNLKKAVEENPVLVIVAGAAAVTAVAKLVEASGNRAGSRAYAKAVNHKIKTNSK